MSKFKVTILDQNTGEAVSEVIESNVFPYVGYPQHSMGCGAYGIPLKVELVIDASSQNTFDHTVDV